MRAGVSAALVTTLFAATGAASAFAEEDARAHYVTASSLNVRLCPEKDCPTAAKLAHGSEVSVYERTGDWARISAFYNAGTERAAHPDIKGEKVARWVAADFLSKTKPKARPLVTGSIRRDKRILHLPRPGEGGLTAEDVRLLYKYANKVLKSGGCTSITNGDKNKQGKYFVTCGNEYQSRYFTKKDVK